MINDMTHALIDDDSVVEQLRGELAILQEATNHIETNEKPLLMARYLSTLGEREHRLLQLQIEVRACERRIALVQALRNRGAVVDAAALHEIHCTVEAELAQWRQSLVQHEQALREADYFLRTLKSVPAEQVQRAKQSYRQLARWLHPDMHPEHADLFAQFWPAVQAAYENYDADQLDILVQVVARVLPAPAPLINPAQTAQRLRELIALAARHLSALHTQAPMCYRVQLSDPHWIATRCQELDSEIEREAQRLAQCVSHLAELQTQSP